MITILDDPNSEVMTIKAGDRILFYGNYWNFPREPRTISQIFNKLGIPTEVLPDPEPLED